MKKSFVFFIIGCVLLAFLLTSCSEGEQPVFGKFLNEFLNDSGIISNPEDEVKARMDKVMEAIKNKDSKALKSNFSKRIIGEAENFDQSILDLFAFIEGDYKSYKYFNYSEEAEMEKGAGFAIRDSSFDINTSKERYRISFRERIKDRSIPDGTDHYKTNPDNLGIESLYIILASNTDEKFAYGGAGSFYNPKIGIVIERERREFLSDGDRNAAANRKIADPRMNEILSAIKNKDSAALKAMFSKKVIKESKNLDQNITDLFNFFEGDFISYDNRGDVGVQDGEIWDKASDKKVGKELESTFDITTSKQKYGVYVCDNITDESDPDNIGLNSLYIILDSNKNEEEKTFGYWGSRKDGYPELGIVIQREKSKD